MAPHQRRRNQQDAAKPARVVVHESRVVKIERRVKKTAELVIEDTSKFAWHFFLGCIILLYTLMFLFGTIIFYLTLEFILLIVRDGIVYGIMIFGDIFLAILAIIRAVISGLNDVTGGASSAISDVSSAFGGPSVSIPSIPIPSLSSILGSWFVTMMAIDQTCLDMNTWQKVLFALIKTIFSRWTCPVLRFVSPSWWVIGIMDPLLSWSSYPYLPIESENCQAPDGELLCAILDFYLVIGGLIIPLLFYRAIFDSYKESGFLHDLVALLKPIVRMIFHLLGKLLP